MTWGPKIEDRRELNRRKKSGRRGGPKNDQTVLGPRSATLRLEEVAFNDVKPG